MTDITPDRFKNYPPQVRQLVLDFEQQQESHPRFFDVDQLEVIADYYLETCDTDGLETAVDYGEKLFPHHLSFQIRRAQLLSIQGHYSTALRLLKNLLKAEPDNTEIHYSLANIYSLTNHPKLAIHHYLAAATDGYELGMVYGNIGDEYNKMGCRAEAVRYYRRAVMENPGEERSLRALAIIWQQQGRLSRAKKFFTLFIAAHPYSKTAWAALAGTLFDESFYQEAADAYEYALAIDESFFHAYQGLAECYRQMGDVPKAVQTLHMAAPYTDDQASLLFIIGCYYHGDKNFHTAYTYFRDAVNLAPTCSLFWSYLGHCCEKMDYIDEAASHYRHAASLDPDTDEPWLELATFYIRQGQYDLAVKILEDSRNPTDPFLFDELLIFCYFRLGLRNRMFALLQNDAPQYASQYPMLLLRYPEFAVDSELVTAIQQWSEQSKHQ